MMKFHVTFIIVLQSECVFSFNFFRYVEDEILPSTAALRSSAETICLCAMASFFDFTHQYTMALALVEKVSKQYHFNYFQLDC